MRPIERLGLGPQYEFTNMPDGYQVKVTPHPLMSKRAAVIVNLTDDQFERFLQWRNQNFLIQDALPDLSPAVREMLMTGLDDEAFKKAVR